MIEEKGIKKRTVKRPKRVKAPKKVPKTKERKQGSRDIGVNVIPPKGQCTDKNCPFHGTLPVRGQIIEGVVVSDKMDNTVVVKKDYRRYIPKYERYELRTGKYKAHNPPCIDAKVGTKVKIMECRALSKTKSFVVIEQRAK
ncbi:MAG: 30S ribosomal protein S17 [Thermoplasmata archaeon]|nr:MAG: 30S ribosomal protein S17 [Thermoplasmata archaeon]